MIITIIIKVNNDGKRGSALRKLITIVVSQIAINCSVPATSIIYTDYGKMEISEFGVESNDINKIVDLPVEAAVYTKIKEVNENEILVSGFHYGKTEQRDDWGNWGGYLDFSYLFDKETSEFSELSTDMIVTDIMGDVFVGIHQFGRDGYYFEDHYDDDNRDMLSYIGTFAYFNPHIALYNKGKLSRLTYHGWNFNPSFIDNSTIIFYSDIKDSLCLSNLEGSNIWFINLGLSGDANHSIHYDLFDSNDDKCYDTIVLGNNSEIYTVKYTSGMEEPITSVNALFEVEGSINYIKVIDSNLLYVLTNPGDNTDLFLYSYRLDNAEIANIINIPYLTPPYDIVK